MTGSLLLWGLLALTIFWSVGVYNRLMRMRARALDALGSVEKHLRSYGTMVQPHLGVDTDALPSTWRHLGETLTVMDTACKNARNTPLAVVALGELTEALDRVQQAWRVLHEAPADLAGSHVPEVLLTGWEDTSQKVKTARGGYNQIVVRYNEAIAQLPARLVVGFMGFRPAGTL
jgi:LemA protein